MKRSPLNKISKNQKARLEQWKRIKLIKIRDNICEWCGDKGQNNELFQLDCHHKLSRARGGKDTLENAYTCHRICHSEITDFNIDVREYPTQKIWEEKNV